MDEKNKRGNIFLTDKIAQKAFCVGGLFYPVRNTLYYLLQRTFQRVLSGAHCRLRK